MLWITFRLNLFLWWSEQLLWLFYNSLERILPFFSFSKTIPVTASLSLFFLSYSTTNESSINTFSWFNCINVIPLSYYDFIYRNSLVHPRFIAFYIIFIHTLFTISFHALFTKRYILPPKLSAIKQLSCLIQICPPLPFETMVSSNAWQLSIWIKSECSMSENFILFSPTFKHIISFEKW